MQNYSFAEKCMSASLPGCTRFSPSYCFSFFLVNGCPLCRVCFLWVEELCSVQGVLLSECMQFSKSWVCNDIGVHSSFCYGCAKFFPYMVRTILNTHFSLCPWCALSMICTIFSVVDACCLGCAELYPSWVCSLQGLRNSLRPGCPKFARQG